MTPNLNHQLQLLTRYYLAKTPSTASLIPAHAFPSNRELSLASNQQALVEAIFLRQEEESVGNWEKVFWKRLIKAVEAGFDERRLDGDRDVEEEILSQEVNAIILEEMVKHLSSTASSSSLRRTWAWGPLDDRARWTFLTTVEDNRLISSGTTGLRTWQASIALSNHLTASFSESANSSLLLPKNARIVELGAGQGLVSLVAATLEPTIRVVATDVNEHVLQQLEENVRRNGLDDRIYTSSLDWELSISSQIELTAWEAEVLGEGNRADLILGADIVYDPDLSACLAATLTFLLRRRLSLAEQSVQPKALIAGTVRNESTWELFLKECSSRSLSVNRTDLKVPENDSGIVGAEGWERDGEIRLVEIIML